MPYVICPEYRPEQDRLLGGSDWDTRRMPSGSGCLGLVLLYILPASFVATRKLPYIVYHAHRCDDV